MEAITESVVFEKYPVYKNSGVEWLGEVPEHWEVVSLGSLLELKSDKNHPGYDVLSVYREYGVIQKDSREDNHNATALDTSTYKAVEPGDLVVNKMKAWQGSMGISAYRGIVSPAYITCKVNSQKIHSAYLHQLLRCNSYIGEYNRLSYGVRVGQWDMHYEDFKKIAVALPTATEQIAIANLINTKLSQIDNAIAQKEKQIELLKERRQVLIHKAVTRGLNPDVPLKDSGVEWIGEIPEHWEVKRLKYFVHIQGGFAFNSNDFKDEGVQIIKIANTYMNELCLDRQPTFVDYSYLKSHKDWIVKKGDILMSLTGTLGKRDYGFAILINSEDQFLLNQRVGKITVKAAFEADYILNILQSEMYLNQLYLLPSGTKQANLSNDNVINIKVAFPSEKKERNEILKHVESIRAKISTTINCKEKEIAKLKEYKATLINSAVTGKIKVKS